MKITFVHLVEQIQFEPQTAMLSTVARSLGHEVSRVGCDFGTRQNVLNDQMLAEAPDLFAVRVTAELRDAVAFSLQELKKAAPQLRVLLYGPLAEVSPDDFSAIVDGAIVLGDEPEQALFGLLSAEMPSDLGSAQPPAGCGLVSGGSVRWGESLPLGDATQAPPPDYALFGLPQFLGRATGCSFFGEPGTILLEASIGAPSGMPGNAALRCFNYPTMKAPRARGAAQVFAFIDALPPEVQRVDFADREFDWHPEIDAMLAGIKERSSQRQFSIRLLPNTTSPEFLKSAKAAGVDRVVFEYDAGSVEKFAHLEGAQSAQKLEELLAVCDAEGLSAGLFVSVGLPGESKPDIEAKLAFIKARPNLRIRFFPFEAMVGHPWHAWCAEKGILPSGDGSWNREVYSPLNQEEMPIEAWHYAWQECLDVQAHASITR